MWALLALVASEATDVPVWHRGVQSAITATEAVIDQIFDCLDKQNKVYLVAHQSSATPEAVVDSALLSCRHLKQLYADAVSKPPSPIPISEGQRLADDFFISLRAPFIKSVDELLVKPNIADARANLVLSQWRDCIVTKAKGWSRLRDDAATIARATVTACHNERQNAAMVFGYQLRSKSLPSRNSQQMTESLEGTMTDIAVEKIISERAKRLPTRR